jgi:hypothetical protein
MASVTPRASRPRKDILSVSGAKPRVRPIVVPEDEKLVAMYTTDVEAIRRYVNANTRYGKFVDPEIIRDINVKANMMTDAEFRHYMNQIDPVKYGMVEYYQAIIANDPAIFKILPSKKQTSDDALYLINNMNDNYTLYRYFHLDGEQFISMFDVPEEILYLR